MFDQHKEIYLFFTVLRPDSTLQATWIHAYLKLLRLSLSGGQPSRLTKFFVEYYRFVKKLSQLYNQLGYETYLKLLRLPLLGDQPSRLTKSFVG